MDPAIFLDRDGTLVPDDANAGIPARVTLCDGAAASLRRLRDAGFRLVVATNQGGVARGRFTESDVDAVHAKLSELIDQQTGLKRTIERYYYCPFHPKGIIPEYTREHPWRKPRAGMLTQAAQDMELDLERSWLIGDSPRDVAAGRTAGLRTILVSRDRTRIADAAADYSAATLAEAVEIVLRHRDETTASLAGTRAIATKPRTTTRRVRQERDGERMRRAFNELTEEIRALRLRRAESSAMRLTAMGLQLVAIFVFAVALLNLGDIQAFERWTLAAAMIQLVTITMLLFDRQ
jgi:histidinol-phosphate phosphatase family protein